MSLRTLAAVGLRLAAARALRLAAALPLLVAAALPLLLGTGPAAAQLPLFDAHIHYSRPDWDVYTPERVLSILAQAGIRRAIVSSTPDDGTLKLYDKAPAGIVPFLRPYRTRDDMSSWTRDPAVAAYVEERLKRGVHRGIGEVHFGLNDVTAPTVRRIAELAGQHNLFLQCHVDEATVEAMLTTYPGVRILWAHAGMSSPPAVVGRLLDRFPLLWVELSMRGDVAPGGTLDPEWKALFLRKPDRFMVGTDTWTTSRWEAVRGATAAVQQWLRQLPPDLAEQIAYKNGERLFP
jgi:hypothetical protein